MSWSEPLTEGVRVLDDIDTWVVQITKKPEVTSERPKELTYTFVKLDRGTDDDDLRKQIVKRQFPEYMKLWKKAKEAWGMEKALYDSDGSNVKELLARVEGFCREFLELRQDFKEELDMTVRSQKDLYESSVQCLRKFMDYRSCLAYLVRHPEADAKDGVWEVYKEMNYSCPVQDPQDLEIVICTIGAVCPKAYEKKNKGSLQKFVDEIWYPDSHQKPKSGTPEWLDIVLSQMISYGSYANLEEQCFIHEDDAIPWAKEQLGSMSFMLGFALDRQANAIGSTGWDFLSGDITAGLKRPPPPGKETEHELMRKISGLAAPEKAPN